MSEVQRAEVFGEAADTYDAARPDYPAEAIDVIVADDPSSAIDVGCGTGKAARRVMERGITVLGIEPDRRMAAVAQRHGVNVVCERFEDWPSERFESVFSAQAWHWVDPMAGAWKSAEVLPSGGRWSAMWNQEDDVQLTSVLVDAYTEWAPQLIDERRAARSRGATLTEVTRQGLDTTAAFGVMERHDVAWTEQITVAKLVDRLSTHSGHRVLPPEIADRLHDRVADELGGPDAVLELDYTTMVLTSRRR